MSDFSQIASTRTLLMNSLLLNSKSTYLVTNNTSTNAHFVYIRIPHFCRASVFLNFPDFEPRIILQFYCSTDKWQQPFDILKAFFVRHSSEYKTSDSDRKVDRNIYPDAGLRPKTQSCVDKKSSYFHSGYSSRQWRILPNWPLLGSIRRNV